MGINLNWEGFSAIGTIFLAALAFVSLPQVQARISRPKIKLRILGPSTDNNNQYWHLEIENKGKVLKNAAAYISGYREDGGKEQIIPFVRFEWPYEDYMTSMFSASKSGFQPLRDIISIQYTDFFSTLRPKPDLLPGRLHSSPQTTKIKLPHDKGHFIDIAVQVVGEQFESEKFWFRITRKEDAWDVRQNQV